MCYIEWLHWMHLHYQRIHHLHPRVSCLLGMREPRCLHYIPRQPHLHPILLHPPQNHQLQLQESIHHVRH